jgi:hypothetical protein
MTSTLRFSIGITSKENLFKVDAERSRLEQVESHLWHGQVDAALAMFAQDSDKAACNFCAYPSDPLPALDQLPAVSSGTTLLDWFWSCGICCQADGLPLETIGRSVEARKCQSDVTTTLCLSQSNFSGLALFHIWDAPDAFVFLMAIVKRCELNDPLLDIQYPTDI